MSGPIPLLPYPCSGKVRRPLSWADRTYPSPQMQNLSLNGRAGPFAPGSFFPLPLPASAPAALSRPHPPHTPNPVLMGDQVGLWGGGLTGEPIGERGCRRVRGRKSPPLGLVLEDFLFVELASGAWPDMGRRRSGAQAGKQGNGCQEGRTAGRGPGRGQGSAGPSAGRGPARRPLPATRCPPAAAAYPRQARAGCCTGAARRPAQRPTGPRSRPWWAAEAWGRPGPATQV